MNYVLQLSHMKELQFIQKNSHFILPAQAPHYHIWFVVHLEVNTQITKPTTTRGWELPGICRFHVSIGSATRFHTTSQIGTVPNLLTAKSKRQQIDKAGTMYTYCTYRHYLQSGRSQTKDGLKWLFLFMKCTTLTNYTNGHDPGHTGRHRCRNKTLIHASLVIVI